VRISGNQVHKIFEVHVHRVYSARPTPDVDFVRQADSLVLSRQALDLQKVREATQRLPDIRQDTVQSIRNKINSGTYQVNEVDIAKKILLSSLRLK
jgi:flagellar biosynthesis anti-sigma factor FlgM